MNETLRQHPDWMREFDHTADVGVEVEAPDRASLYERAAYAMFWLLADVDDVALEVTIPVTIDARDPEELMVNWLSELNYRHQVDGLVFSDFKIESVSETELVGAASGEISAHGRPAIFCELKAVTFHDLAVDCRPSGCTARIIFDI